jgi:urease accessory protein
VLKPFHPEGDAVQHDVVVHPPGGIAGGDEIDIQVHLQAGSHALLTSPGAAKWYRSTGAWAQQRLQVQVADGATMEWLPLESIFFTGARARLQTRFELAATARLLAWDMGCVGRPAADELFETGEIRQQFEIVRAGKLLFAEQACIAGGSEILRARIGLSQQPIFATLVAVGEIIPENVVQQVREIAVQGSLSITQLPEVCVVRYLGADTEDAWKALRAAWALLRPVITQRPAVAPRIWNT